MSGAIRGPTTTLLRGGLLLLLPYRGLEVVRAPPHLFKNARRLYLFLETSKKLLHMFIFARLYGRHDCGANMRRTAPQGARRFFFRAKMNATAPYTSKASMNGSVRCE